LLLAGKKASGGRKQFIPGEAEVTSEEVRGWENCVARKGGGIRDLKESGEEEKKAMTQSRGGAWGGGRLVSCGLSSIYNPGEGRRSTVKRQEKKKNQALEGRDLLLLS